MSAYYNEFDPKAAAWLRELIAQKLIADGEVDETDIRDVRPTDLDGFTQCHFFAGIGVWSAALRDAGWPDDRPVWTGSCSCQPFSAAGAGKGFADERHVWPHWFHLIQHARAAGIPIFGEQVASKDGLAWLDLVQSDLEGTGNTFWPFDLCAAGFGAPHERQRLYWVADCISQGLEGHSGDGRNCYEPGRNKKNALRPAASKGAVGIMADTESAKCQHTFTTRAGWVGAARECAIERLANTNGGNASTERQQCSGQQRQLAQNSGSGELFGVDDAECIGRDAGRVHHTKYERLEFGADERISEKECAAGPTNGGWANTDWLGCRDGKFRPVRPGSFPLVDGATARVVRLRGYGNAIVKPQAQAFIEAVMDVQREFGEVV